jgi:hypothetical protein
VFTECFKGGTQLGICFVVSELVHFVALERGIAVDAEEQGAESVCGAKEVAVTGCCCCCC